MNNNPNQPREFDAVLGGQAPPPVEGVVLGGLEGVKRRLTSPVVEARITALSEALNYGESGLDLVIGALKDSLKQVQRYAARLLREKGGLKGKQALLNYDPWLFFTTLQDWKFEEFNPKIGITDSIGNAYSVNLNRIESSVFRGFDLSQFQILLHDSQASRVEALVCNVWDEHWQRRYTQFGQRHTQFSTLVNALFDANEQLTTLKALFIGDRDTTESKFMYSTLELGDISPILKAYPNLEVLQVRGGWGLEFKPMRHERLKTLVLETGLILIQPDTINQICTLDLPALEYLELWLGGSHRYREDVATPILLPILSGELFPSLKYLGLRSSDYSDNIAFCLVESPTVIDRLAVLDMSRGTLTDEGAEVLLKCPAVNRLHTLDVSVNCLSTDMIQRLSQLNCLVIADSQENEELEYGDRYSALYE